MTTEASDDAVGFALQAFLGMEIGGDDVGSGSATIDLTSQHHNPNGVVHGAVLFARVDPAMGKATMNTVEEGSYCASVEVGLRFIRPVAVGRLVAEATVVKRGRSIAHLEARVHDADDRLIATATGTFAILVG